MAQAQDLQQHQMGQEAIAGVLKVFMSQPKPPQQQTAPGKGPTVTEVDDEIQTARIRMVRSPMRDRLTEERAWYARTPSCSPSHGGCGASVLNSENELVERITEVAASEGLSFVKSVYEKF